MQKYVLILLSVIICLLVGTIIYKNHQYSKLQVATTVQPILDTVKQKTDKNGNSYVQIKENIYTEAQVKKLSDSLHKIYGGKIQTVTKFVTRIDTYSKIVPIFIDTTHIFAEDSSKDIKISFSGDSKADIGQFKLNITPDTTLLIFSEKRHLFKKDEINVDITHTNKLFQTSYGSAYTYNPKKVQFAMGPSLGYSYFLGKGLQPSFGFTLTFNLISIKYK